ncbi:alpha-glucosidase C-terminal domain-containing protein [Bacillus sp. Bva_UNVM-123]|uniref:alpha-amylase family glycosyl hydrolase n=1 Tax=Bacillus sp. Bva_UNVM-123 TaxID=2829798 RepID=UPI00391EEE41
MRKGIKILCLIPLLLLYALPVGAVEEEERKWQDESIYFLMVDRFSNGDFQNDYQVDVKDPESYHGGDFQGIINKLDYIKDMGFTTIWLSSIFDNEEKGYHGFWIQDYYNTEEHFGTIDEFKQLVKEAHKRDMKVMIDFIVNQVGPNHPWLKDSEKTEWFHEEKDMESLQNQQELEEAWVDGLPDLKQENPEVKNYLIDAAKWWITETNIDGYHLNAINYVPKSFLSEFTKEIKGIKNDFYLLGEVKSEDEKLISQYGETGLDGFINYPLMEKVRPIFAAVDQSTDNLLSAEIELNSVYRDPNVMGNLMDNNQTVRFTRDAITKNQHPGPRWKLALTHLYTIPGIPIVYYGSEIALDGGLGVENHGQMDFRTDKDLIDYITKLGELRKTLPSLTRGTFEILAEENDMAVYKRTYQDETTVIAINNSSESQTVTLNAEQLEDENELRGLLANDLVRSSDGQYTLYMDREKAEIYVLAPKTGLNIPYLAAMGVVYVLFITFIFMLWKRSKRKAD